MAKVKHNKTDNAEQGMEGVENTLSKFEIFFEKNMRTISYSIIGVIAIGLAVFGYNKFIHQPKETKAYQEMFMAEYYFSVDSLDLALNGDGTSLGFNDIISEFKRTSAANLANYYTGMILMKKGEFEQAIKHLKKYKSKDQITSAMALGAIGDANVELGNLKNAIKYYTRAAENKDNNFVSPIFFNKAAWANEEAGNKEEALKIYKLLYSKYNRTNEGQEATRHIARLEAELKK